MFTRLKGSFYSAVEPLAHGFNRLGFSPNGLTWFALSMGLATCSFYLWNRNAVLFGCLMILWGLLDGIDGALARISNRVTKFGSYLDAMCDRVFETAAVFVVAWVSGYWALSFALIVAALLISYAKARAAMEMAISNKDWPDLMERPERDLIFAIGLIVWGLYPHPVFGRDILFWLLLGLNMALYVTVVQRFLRARRFLQSR